MKRHFYKIVLSLLLFTALHTQAQINTPDYVPANGLVGWWPFTGNAVDSSGNNNNGTVTDAVLTTDRFGNAGKAYSFNGVTSMIDVQDAASLRCRTLTISAWVKYRNTSVTNQVVYKGSMQANGEAYALTIDVGGKPFSASKYNSNCVSGTGWLGPGTGAVIDTGIWVHLVTTFDGITSKLYKNGALESSMPTPGLIDSCIGGGVRFGYDHRRYAASTGDPFNGSIDDIGIWNRALTDAEILHLYNASLTTYGNVGINTDNPQRSLHIKDVLRLEPRSVAPSSPAKGDIYFDDTINKLRVFDGTVWQNCW